MFQQILIAVDLTATSEPALRAAVSLAREQQAKLTVLHVSERHHQAEHWLVPFFEEEMRIYAGAVEREEQAARDRLDGAVKAQLAGGAPVAYEVVVIHGRAADAIVETAAQRDASLIVVGTHGQGGVLGSVAERVVRSARRPVLVVPSQS